MTELVPQETAIAYPGDFMGAEDEEHLYHMLGLEYGASEDEVRDAARELLGEYHPDQGGDRAAYITIRQVRDILTGEAFEEPEFTDLEEYEEFQMARGFFDGQEVDERASSMTEFLYKRFRTKAERKKFEQALQEKDETEGTNYHENYQQLQDREEHVDSKEGMIETEVEKEKLKAEALGRDIDEEELEEAVRSHFEEREEQVEDTVRVRGGGYYMDSERYPSLAERELTDLTVHGNITFVEDKEDQDFGIADAKKDEEVVRATMAGKDNKLKRSNPVHCKVPEGTVTVEDAGLRGTIQVLNGNVEVDIDSFSGFGSAPVVRARAPQVNVEAGYDEHGAIYVPENRENVEPTEQNTDLDIAVMEGEVTLDDSQDLLSSGSSLEENDSIFDQKIEKDLDGINDLL
jgi:curved DNA-binding protein CbpA